VHRLPAIVPRTLVSHDFLLPPTPLDFRRNLASRRHGALALCLATALSLFAAAASQAGVRLLNPGEDMTPQTPTRPIEPIAGPDGRPLPSLKIAVVNGKTDELAGLAPRDVPFDTVPPNAAPDLIWDAGSKTASAGSKIIAYRVEKADLPAVIDRTAVLRVLNALVSEKPQTLRVDNESATRHKGDKVDIEIPGVANRALVLFNIAGDGTVQTLYPLGSDPHVLTASPYRLSLQMHEPFGTDVMVVVTASQPMPKLDQGLREISHFKSAGQALRLILTSLPSDARIGTLALTSVP